MQVHREALLAALQSVQPGLAAKEGIDQSTCFVFSGDRVYTLSDDLACSAPSPLKNIEAAVPALKFLGLLEKLTEEDLDVEVGETEIVLKGQHGRRAGVKIETKIELLEHFPEKPKKWKPLPEDYNKAVGIVQGCSGFKEKEGYRVVCILVHPEYLEATDNFQFCRWPLATGIREAVLIRTKALKNVPALGMTEFSETDAWLHFRNPSDLILSCRRTLDDIEEADEVYEVEGETITLPKSLIKESGAAEVCLDDKEDKNVQIRLKPGKLLIRGEGTHSWYQVPKTLADYKGPRMEFFINPEILRDIVEKHNEVIVSSDKLKVDTGSYQYVANLFVPSEMNGAHEEEVPKKKKKVKAEEDE